MPLTECSGSECTDLLAWLGSLTGAQPGAKPFPMKSAGGPSFDEITHPHAGDWPTYHGSIGGNRHSSLNQITAGNVNTLAVQWIFPVNHFALEVTPVVVDGVMYVTGRTRCLRWMAGVAAPSGITRARDQQTFEETRRKEPTAEWLFLVIVCF